MSRLLINGLLWGMIWLLAGLIILLIVGPDAADVPFPVGFGALGFFSGLIHFLLARTTAMTAKWYSASTLQTSILGILSGTLLASLICTYAITSGNEDSGILVMIPVLAIAGGVTAAIVRIIHLKMAVTVSRK